MPSWGPLVLSGPWRAPWRTPGRAFAWAFRKTLKWGTVATVWAVIVFGVTAAWYATDLPDVDKAVNATRRPVVTVLALNLPQVFGGAIITENVFKVNGIGQLLITALFANDLPMVMTLTFIFAVLIVLFNLIADVLYGILDPRIRYD